MNDTHVLIELIALIYLTELKEDLMIRISYYQSH